MIWHNARIQTSRKIASNLKNNLQLRHKSHRFPVSPHFYPQNHKKPVRQLPRSKSGSVSLDIGLPKFYKKPVIQHNLIRAAKEKLLRDAAPPSAPSEVSDVISRVERLDPIVEDAVNKEVLRDLNAFTFEALRQYKVTIKHPDVSPSIPGYLDRHRLQSESVKFMWSALQDLLPEDPLNQRIESTAGAMSHKRFRYERQGAQEPLQAMSQMSLAWYLLMSNIPIKPEQLLEDGTNKRFMPGTPETWPYRLWAGGSITQHTDEPMPIDTGQTVHKTERAVNIRIEGPERPEKAFITVQKDFFAIDSVWPRAMYNKQTILEALSGQKSPKDHTLSNSIRDRDRDQAPYKTPFATETYTLCFLRSPPDFSSTATRIVAAPKLPRFQHTLVPSRHLLFCWSALTYNAHLIHLDPQYARTVYKAPNLLVHGPLTAFMALEWFERTMTKYAVEREFPPFELRSVEYRNLSPLYVDEPMTLCTKPTRFQTPGTLADSWDVWIEKKVSGGGGDQSTMAFKATVKLAVGSDALNQGGSRVVRSDGRKRDEEEKGRMTESFRSPFFS